MESLFTIPQECHSKQEVLTALENIGIKCNVQIGILLHQAAPILGWFGSDNKRAAFIPLFKDTPHLDNIDMCQFYNIDSFFFFCHNQNFYCIDKEVVRRINVLFCADLAIEAASLILDEEVDTVQLCKLFPTAYPNAYQTICWVFYDSEGLPHFQPVFQSDEMLLQQRCASLPRVTYELFEKNDIFDRNGTLWQIRSGEHGQEIIPLPFNSKITS